MANPVANRMSVRRHHGGQLPFAARGRLGVGDGVRRDDGAALDGPGNDGTGEADTGTGPDGDGVPGRAHRASPGAPCADAAQPAADVTAALASMTMTVNSPRVCTPASSHFAAAPATAVYAPSSVSSLCGTVVQ